MIKIKQKHIEKRLDVFLLEQLEQQGLKTLSRNFVTSNWGGLVEVNDLYPKQSYKLKEGDEVTIHIEKIKELEEKMQRSSEIKGEDGNLDVLFECEDFLVVEKKKGVVVHPGIDNMDGTLANYVRGYLEEKDEFDPSVDRAGIVHRLDKSVSGLIVFAKNLRMQNYLKEQFEQHLVRKIYLADIEYKQLKRGIGKFFPVKSLNIESEINTLEGQDFKCDSTWFKAKGYIARSRKNRIKMQFRRYKGRVGKSALSFIKPISEDQLLIVIKTGRMHQIRATLEYFGIGIKSDTLYGVSKSSTLPEEIGLKSVFLGFKELDGEDFSIMKY